jgi:predicted TIM-barrel fold metal-dependent hydrolase
LRIDAWIQHPTPRLLADPMLAPLLRWISKDTLPSLPPAFTLAALDHAKLDHAIASAWYGPQGPLISNEEVLSLCALAPHRISGLCGVDLRRPMAALAELDRCVALGMKGLRLLPWLWELPPDDRRLYPLYARLCQLELPLCLQVGHTGPLAPSEFGRPIPYLERVALDFPELTIVAGHIGAPWVEEMIFLARKFERIHIDTSAYRPSRYSTPLLDFMRSRTGREKVLFGSNHPMILPQQALSEVDSLGLDEPTRDLFLGGNAQRIFKLRVERHTP